MSFILQAGCTPYRVVWRLTRHLRKAGLSSWDSWIWLKAYVYQAKSSTCHHDHVFTDVARFQAKLVLGQTAANVKIRGRILFAVRGCETILFCT